LEGTYPLEAIEGGTCQDIEKGEGVSQTYDNTTKTSEHRTLTSRGHRQKDKSGQKKLIELIRGFRTGAQK
jgi:hypothetical protein